MKISPQPLLDQGSALDAYFDAMMLPQDAATPLPSSADVTDTVPVTQTVADDHAHDGQVDAGDVVRRAEPDPNCIRALLFEVAGVTLALPMDSVKAVVPNEAALAPAQEQAGLLLGVCVHGGFDSTVVDTARLVLPVDRTGQLAGDPAERARHLVIVDDGRWALACSRAGDVVEFERDAVKWRTAAGKRPWLAGMVAEKRCALLDVEGLKQLLADQMA